MHARASGTARMRTSAMRRVGSCAARRLHDDAHRAAGARSARRRRPANAASRALVDGLQRPAAQRARSTRRSPTTSTCGRDGAHRRRARAGDARAVEPLSDARCRRQRRPQRAYRESAAMPHSAGARRRRPTTTASRSTRRTSSTCGASTARRRAPRRTICSRREYARETVRTVVAAEVARAYFGLLAADAQLALLRDTLSCATRRSAAARPLRRRRHRRLRPRAGEGRARRGRRRHRAWRERAIAQFESALAALTGPLAARRVHAEVARSASTAPRCRRCRACRRDCRRTCSNAVPTSASSRRRSPPRACGSTRARRLFPVRLADRRARHRVGGAVQSVQRTVRSSGRSAPALLQPLFNLKAIDANVRRRPRAAKSSSSTIGRRCRRAFKRRPRCARREPDDAGSACRADRAQRQSARRHTNFRTCATRPGYSPYLEVLDAQRQLLQAQTLQILAARDVRLALVDLAKALGGGWEYETAVEPRGSGERQVAANALQRLPRTDDRMTTAMNVIDTRLPELLRGKRALLGMFVGIPSPSLVEMCGHAGVDFVIVDNEHGPAGIESTEHMLRAARASGVIPVVRTLESDILRVLDIGASAIQVPQVNSAEQARRIVAAAKYPPLGMRGAAFSTRAAGYGFFAGDRHVADSNTGTAVIVMTETRTAIEKLDEILSVPGIDAVFFGPNDFLFVRLSRADGTPGRRRRDRARHRARARARGRARRARADAGRLPSLAPEGRPLPADGPVGTARQRVAVHRFGGARQRQVRTPRATRARIALRACPLTNRVMRLTLMQWDQKDGEGRGRPHARAGRQSRPRIGVKTLRERAVWADCFVTWLALGSHQGFASLRALGRTCRVRTRDL